MISLAAADLNALERLVGVQFDDPSLLARAVAHRSWCGENGEVESNERLEFLGDSVLGLVVTHYVYEHFPHLFHRPRQESQPTLHRLTSDLKGVGEA